MQLCPPLPRRHTWSRRGFSFTEILFAVMILGIGFIMVAAIFPVAMQQTAQSGDEVVAASISKEATDSLTSVANNFIMPPTIPASQLPPPKPNPGESTPRPEETRALPSFPQLGQHVNGQVWSFHDDRAHNWTTLPSISPGIIWTDLYQINSMWNSVNQNLILPSDRRYAWVAMYRRDGHWVQSAATIIPPANATYVKQYNGINGTPSAATFAYIEPDPYIQLIVIAVQVRNSSAYDPTVDLQRSQNQPNQPATLEPKLLAASFIVNPNNGVPVIQFDNSSGANETDRLGPGAFAVISDDGIASTPSEATLSQFAGQFNGHIYRLGNYRPDLNAPNTATYELAPGYDVFPDPRFGANIASLVNVKVFVVGRGYANHNDPNNGGSILQFDGAVQDIAAYTTLIYAN